MLLKEQWRIVSSLGQPIRIPWQALSSTQLVTVTSGERRIARRIRQSSPVRKKLSLTVTRRQLSMSIPSLLIIC